MVTVYTWTVSLLLYPLVDVEKLTVKLCANNAHFGKSNHKILICWKIIPDFIFNPILLKKHVTVCMQFSIVNHGIHMTWPGFHCMGRYMWLDLEKLTKLSHFVFQEMAAILKYWSSCGSPVLHYNHARFAV